MFNTYAGQGVRIKYGSVGAYMKVIYANHLQILDNSILNTAVQVKISIKWCFTCRYGFPEAQ